MNMREIETICELINYDNFNEAAFGLSCSASVITRYVANVEEELGIKLFVRSRKASKLSPTPEGLEIIEVMTRIKNDYHYLLERSNQLKTGQKNLLRIGAQPRFGNLHEQEILSTFLLDNMNVEINMFKSSSGDLARMFCAGKLDAIFITLHGYSSAQDYLKQKMPQLDFEITYLTTEYGMYCGISEKYFPGRDEVSLAELKDFTFALPFSSSDDSQETNAMRSWKKHARKANFTLKSLNLGAFDDTVFQLATVKQIAVCTSNIPAKRDGIKFVKISDWEEFTNLYFVCRKGTQNPALNNLQRIVRNYRNQLGTGEVPPYLPKD